MSICNIGITLISCTPSLPFSISSSTSLISIFLISISDVENGNSCSTVPMLAMSTTPIAVGVVNQGYHSDDVTIDMETAANQETTDEVREKILRIPSPFQNNYYCIARTFQSLKVSFHFEDESSMKATHHQNYKIDLLATSMAFFYFFFAVQAI